MRTLPGLKLVFFILLIGCGSGETGADYSFDEEEGLTPVFNTDRPLNTKEQEIWELTVRCFLDSGIEPYASMGYVEPTILVKDPITDECASPTVSGCARLEENLIVINSRTYFRIEDEIPVTLLVHEIKHLIEHQAGVTYFETLNHLGLWWSLDSPCSNNFLNPRNTEA